MKNAPALFRSGFIGSTRTSALPVPAHTRAAARFITRTAKKIVEAGGSPRDVQELAGHTSLSTTQRYIQGDTVAKRRVVDL
jgi:integrase